MDTLFSNRQLGHNELPQLESLVLQPVDKRYRICNLIITAVLWVLISIGYFLSIEFANVTDDVMVGLWVVMGVITGAFIVLGLYHWFADPIVAYAVREQDIVLRKGLVFQKQVCQPMLRVQHIELKRGPVERLAGLASLQVYSAGGSAHTFEIPGLPAAHADQLRQFILSHKDVSAS